MGRSSDYRGFEEWEPGDSRRWDCGGHRIIRDGNISQSQALELIRHRKTAVISSIHLWESKLIGHVFSHYEN